MLRSRWDGFGGVREERRVKSDEIKVKREE
jgi:hypothetical protein